MKAVAAGAAASVAASLPFVRSVPQAKAANPTDCRKGCVWTANQNYASELRADTASYVIADGALDVAKPVVGYALYPLFSLWYTAAHLHNVDRARAHHRTAFNECFQPFCPGFDPKKAGGPCESCQPPLYCNPCELVDTGYICCIYEPGDCHGDCCHNPPGCQ